LLPVSRATRTYFSKKKEKKENECRDKPRRVATPRDFWSRRGGKVKASNSQVSSEQ